MLDKLVMQAAELMREQSDAYRRLDAACAQLTTALKQGSPEIVAALVRAGETELLKMRARLLRLMFALTAFADARAALPSDSSISPSVREIFGQTSGELQQSAKAFRKTYGRATALAINGATFAAVCIEICGVQPTTYRAPYARRGEGRTWA